MGLWLAVKWPQFVCRFRTQLTFLALVLTNSSAYALKNSEWSGPYAGVNTGYVWGSPDVDQSVLPDPFLSYVPAPITLSPFMKGGSLGVQLGNDWQVRNHVVLGIEYDMNLSNLQGSSSRSTISANSGATFPGIPSASEKINWFGNFRPRFGYLARDTVLIYGTGGFAFAKVNGSSNIDIRQTDAKQYPASFSKILPGWVMGAGIEWEVSEHWSLRTEYLYNKLEDQTCIANAVPYDPSFQAKYVFKTAFQVAQLGISYRF